MLILGRSLPRIAVNKEAVLEKLAKLWRLRSWHTISLSVICVKVCPPTWTLTSTGQNSHAQQPPGDVLPWWLRETTCVLCSKVCKSVAGLKRHMPVHKAVIPQKDIMNPVNTPTLACYICHRPCKSAAGLKSHLRSHERGTAGEVDSNTGPEWDGNHLQRWSNHHVCTYVC